MSLKQTINFTVRKPSRTANYSLPLYKGCDYNAAFNCWSINHVKGYFKFNLRLPQKQGVNLIFQLCSSLVHGKTNCPIDIKVNGHVIVKGFDPHISSFYDVVWPISEKYLKAGDNEVRMTLTGGYSRVFMRYAIVDLNVAPTDEKNWLSAIPDTTPISEVNLPGTHDTAAINTLVSTPYACHRYTVTQQLEGGVRLMDVRLKVKKKGSGYEFVTCHGDIGSFLRVNEYQSFVSFMDECKQFLASNSTETIVMSLKVDDWNKLSSKRNDILKALSDLLKTYPTTSNKDIPTLGSIRGKILLFNRISGDLSLGTPISWSDNTTGSLASSSPNRSYPFYVQDQYKGLPHFGAQRVKFNLVTAAFGHKQPGTVVWNFASATWYGILGVYVMGDLLDYFGAKPANERPAHFGWTLFDYQFEQYETSKYDFLDIVKLVISSNRNYMGYEDTFKVTHHDEL